MNKIFSTSFISSIVIIVITVHATFAQTTELSVNINSFSSTRYNLSLQDSSYRRSYSNIFSFKPTLGVEYSNKNSNEFFINIGYFSEPFYDSTFYKENINAFRISAYKRVTKSYFIRIGIGKRFYYKNYTLSTKASVPIQLNHVNTQISDKYIVDSLFSTLSYTREYDSQPLTIRTGLMFTESLKYKVYKNFHIGFDINFIFSKSFQSGKRIQEVKTTTGGVVTNEISNQYNYKYNSSTEFGITPQFSVIYRFN